VQCNKIGARQACDGFPSASAIDEWQAAACPFETKGQYA
jgi:hypothetical protein